MNRTALAPGRSSSVIERGRGIAAVAKFNPEEKAEFGERQPKAARNMEPEIRGKALGERRVSGRMDSPKLTVLNHKGMLLGDETIKLLAEALRNVPSLEELCFEQNKLTAEGIEALASNFCYILKLKRLNLGDNLFLNEGVNALIVGLKNTPLLEELKLFWNLIGIEGAQTLAHNLCHIPRLKCLDLYNCYVGKEGLQSIINAVIKHSGNLEWLDIRKNLLRGEQIEVYVSRLREHFSAKGKQVKVLIEEDIVDLD